ncbi:MAG TPA: alpha/beta hydrolase [Bacteriovoracaceae bacterium]|nr:alpha/beta hydrolase [Bacteriovoracaceae bacterium]
MIGLEAGKEHPDLIIFIHGFPDMASVWKEYVDELALTYHVIAPQIPLKQVNYLSFQNKILKWIAAKKPRKVFIVGHDLGAVWASSLADLLKKDLTGLILINGMGIREFQNRLKNPEQLLRSWYMFLFQTPLVPELLIKTFPEKLLTIPHLLKQSSFLAHKDGLKTFWQYRVLLKEMLKSIDHRPSIEARTLILWASRDAFLLIPKREEFEEHYKNFQIRIIEGDHWFHLAQTEKVFGLMKKFFGDPA